MFDRDAVFKLIEDAKAIEALPVANAGMAALFECYFGFCPDAGDNPLILEWATADPAGWDVRAAHHDLLLIKDRMGSVARIPVGLVSVTTVVVALKRCIRSGSMVSRKPGTPKQPRVYESGDVFALTDRLARIIHDGSSAWRREGRKMIRKHLAPGPKQDAALALFEEA